MMKPRLKDLRISAGLTQKRKFQKRIRFKTVTYSRYENGVHKIPVKVILNIADFYDTSVDYICIVLMILNHTQLIKYKIFFNKLNYKLQKIEGGLTQSELATKMQIMNVNIDQQMISKIENNDRIVTDYELACFCIILKLMKKKLLKDFYDSLD